MNKKLGLRMAQGGLVQGDERAALYAKYGIKPGGSTPAPQPAPQPVAQGPATVQKPQAGGLLNQAASALSGRRRQLEEAMNYAEGGIVRGKGGPTDDEVPMRVAGKDVNLSNTEAVLPARTVQALGGPKAVEALIEQTNGKPPVKGGLREGGEYALGGIFRAAKAAWNFGKDKIDDAAEAAKKMGQRTGPAPNAANQGTMYQGGTHLGGGTAAPKYEGVGLGKTWDSVKGMATGASKAVALPAKAALGASGLWAAGQAGVDAGNDINKAWSSDKLDTIGKIGATAEAAGNAMLSIPTFGLIDRPATKIGEIFNGKGGTMLGQAGVREEETGAEPTTPTDENPSVSQATGAGQKAPTGVDAMTPQQRAAAADIYRDYVDSQTGGGPKQNLNNKPVNFDGMQKRIDAYTKDPSLLAARNAREELLGSGIKLGVDGKGGLTITGGNNSATPGAPQGAPQGAQSGLGAGTANEIYARANAIRGSMIDSMANANGPSGRGVAILGGGGGGMDADRAALLKKVMTAHPGAQNGQLTAAQINAARGLMGDAQLGQLKAQEIAASSQNKRHELGLRALAQEAAEQRSAALAQRQLGLQELGEKRQLLAEGREIRRLGADERKARADETKDTDALIDQMFVGKDGKPSEDAAKFKKYISQPTLQNLKNEDGTPMDPRFRLSELASRYEAKKKYLDGKGGGARTYLDVTPLGKSEATLRDVLAFNGNGAWFPGQEMVEYTNGTRISPRVVDKEDFDTQRHLGLTGLR